YSTAPAIRLHRPARPRLRNRSDDPPNRRPWWPSGKPPSRSRLPSLPPRHPRWRLPRSSGRYCPRWANPPARRPLPPPGRPPPPPAPTVAVTFQGDILPIFRANCVSCHGAERKIKGGLDARTVPSLLQGGDSGPALVRGDPDKSLLWESVSSNQMPPGKGKLTSAEKAKIRQWILDGAK